MFVSLRGLVMCLFPFCIQRTVPLDQLHLATLGALSLFPFLLLSLLLWLRLLLLSMMMVLLTGVLGLAFLLVNNNYSCYEVSQTMTLINKLQYFMPKPNKQNNNS